MSEELPDHLKPVREILMDSAVGPENDEAPGAPSDLLDDLEESLLGTTAKPLEVSHPSFLERVRALFATPAFGVISALILVLFIAVPILNQEDSDGFRDGDGAYVAGPRIILVGIDDSMFDQLAATGLFDERALVRSDDPTSIEAPKLVLDYTGRSLVGYSPDGNEILREALPEDPSDLARSIARALSRIPAAE